MKAAGALRTTLLSVLLALSAGACGREVIGFEVDLDGIRPGAEGPTISITGLPPEAARLSSQDWKEVVEIRTRAALGDPELPPMLASYQYRDGRLVVTPRFQFAPRKTYRVTFDSAAFARASGTPPRPAPGLEFTTGTPLARPIDVEAVFPSSSVVPENLLRAYIWFSRPVSAKNVHEWIELEDEKGSSVELPFVEVPEGLWDPSGRRLTMFFHPGRLKRGVGPNEALGTPLESGRRYRLVVTAGTAEPFVKSFGVGPADRTSPDPSAWTVRAPAAPGDALEIHFGEPFDHGLLARTLGVVEAGGGPVAGEGVVLANETGWRFRPADAWRPGGYRVVVDPRLEDLAGNSVHELFDRDAAGEHVAESATEKIVLTFRVGG